MELSLAYLLLCVFTLTYANVLLKRKQHGFQVDVSKDIDDSRRSVKVENHDMRLSNVAFQNYRSKHNKVSQDSGYALKQRKVKQLEHDLVHNTVLKHYIQNLLKNFLAEKRKLMRQNEPPEPDIPIELGVEKIKEDDKQSTSAPSKTCDGEPCNEYDDNSNKNVPNEAGSALFDKDQAFVEGSSSAYEQNKEDDNKEVDLIQGENNLSFPPQAPEIPIELGSAFQESDYSSEAVAECKNKRKPCQEPCSETNDCPTDESPPQPDIPIELGSARSDLSDDLVNHVENGDEVTFVPQANLPPRFLLVNQVNNQPETETDYDYDPLTDENSTGSNDEDTNLNYATSGVEHSGEEQAEKRSFENISSGDHNITSNNDGDFDGELLRKIYTESSIENSQNDLKQIPLLSRRKRRSLSDQPVSQHKEGVTFVQKLNVALKKHPSNAKRSDIDDDKELLETIESIDSEIATKRGLASQVLPKDKPLQGYMKNLAHDVRSVMGEAKSVLRNTGRVVHGLKRVINGATVLTSFTNNAVKFAKYFAMEPDNATIDYLEEKAIVAVLEAQKAANEARDAANLAKVASTKARAAESRMEIAKTQHKDLQVILPLIKAATKQATRAEKAAKYATRNKQKTEADVMLMDRELKKMGAQLKVQNEHSVDYKQDNPNPVFKEEVKSPSIDNIKENPLLTQQILSTVGVDDSSSILESKIKPSNDYKDYFYKKQKELEEELKSKAKAGGQFRKNYEAMSSSFSTTEPSISRKDYTAEKVVTSNNETENATENAELQKLSETPKLDVFLDKSPQVQPQSTKLNELPSLRATDTAELQYIASLNKKIEFIKHQEAEAKMKLRAAELARNFVASTTSKMTKAKEQVKQQLHLPPKPAEVIKPITEVILHDNGVHDVQTSKISEPILSMGLTSKQIPSLLKNVVPEKKSKQAKHSKYKANKDKSSETVKKVEKLSTVETPEYNIPNFAKKELMISMRKHQPVQHAPSEYAHAKKHDIFKKAKNLRDSNSAKKVHALRNKITNNEIPNHLLIKSVVDKIDSSNSDADNTVVSDNFNPEQKRERVIYESKLLSEKLSRMNSALRGLKFDINKPDNLPVKRTTPYSNYKKAVVVQKTVDKIPISVTVNIHHNKVRNVSAVDNDKSSEIIDPFGFKNVDTTNEGTISDRTVIPRPDDYYKVVYQRSFIPHPKYDKPVHMASKKDRMVVDDEK